MKYLPLIVKNALRNRRRTVLTVSSLAISLCLLGVMMALYYALFIGGQPAKAQARRVVVRHKVSIVFPLPLYYREKIAQVPGVEEVMLWSWFGGVYKDARDQRNFFARMAADADRLFRVYQDYVISDEEKQAFIRDPAGCIVNKVLAERHGFKVGDRILIRGDIFPFDLDLTVRGIYTSTDFDDETLWFNWKYMENMLRNSPRLMAGGYTLLVRSEQDVAAVSRAIDEMFANSEAPTKTESEYTFGLSFLSFLGNVKVILMSICFAVTFTVLLITANTMAMSVRERVREVGVLRTLGFGKPAIVGLIVGESAMISLIGGLLGVFVAEGLCWVIRQGPAIVQQSKTLTIEAPVFAALMGVSLAVGVASSIAPAVSAARQNIVDALRFTD
ncbi:MAG: ABC transporter ATP-binding protein [Bryobacteraceae bacterium]|nr:MAG: ABC transporter ATP-binding protein [Bryobacteraceae bacterium]